MPLSSREHLFPDRRELVVYLRRPNFHGLGLSVRPEGCVRRIHAVLKVLVDGTALARHVRRCGRQCLEATLRLRPQLPQLVVDLVGVRLAVDVRDDIRRRDHVGGLKQGLGRLAAEVGCAHRGLV